MRGDHGVCMQHTLCPDPSSGDCDQAEHNGPGYHRGQDDGWNHGWRPEGSGVEPPDRSHVRQRGGPACVILHYHMAGDPEESQYGISVVGDILESLESMGASHPGPTLTCMRPWGEHHGPEPEHFYSSAPPNPSYIGWEEDIQNPV